MGGVIGKDRNPAVGKFASVTEYLDAFACPLESCRLADADLIDGKTAVDRNIESRVILTEERFNDKRIGCKLHAEAGEQTQEKPCGRT